MSGDFWFIVLIASLLGGGIGYFFRQFFVEKRKHALEQELKRSVENSKVEAKELLLGAKEKAAKILDEA
ncbi:MAG: hypothetical protein G01um101466_649, partial [Parcubacteria group bacterium Gr01-1014_66]